MTRELWSDEVFTAKLREVGARTYHDKHSFHLAMNEGRLSRDAVRDWVANRFCYQRNIPHKDAAIISNCPLREVRRLWLHRITDHDGRGRGRWRHRSVAAAGRSVRPAARGIARRPPRSARRAIRRGCLREFRAHAAVAGRRRLLAHGTFCARSHGGSARRFRATTTHGCQPSGFDYFKRRLTQARTRFRGSARLTLAHCDTPELQRAAVRALAFKCDVLWSLLDAIDWKYAALATSTTIARPLRPALAPGCGCKPIT